MGSTTFVTFWKALDIATIIGFLAVDFLLFHDFFKPGETFTFVEYLIGLLSIVVVARSIITLKY